MDERIKILGGVVIAAVVIVVLARYDVTSAIQPRNETLSRSQSSTATRAVQTQGTPVYEPGTSGPVNQ